MKKGIGDLFQEETKYERDRMPGGYLEWSKKPETYKQNPDRPRIALPRPVTEGGTPLWDILCQRRSVRDFHLRPVADHQLSQLLWASQGITAEQSGYRFRTVPSAGALYPVETYLVVNDVEGIPQGVYHYNVSEHCLEQLKEGDYRVTIARAMINRPSVIIADEPTAHLDIQHKIETFHLLKKLARELDKCILISTHEIQLALQIADVIWLMNEQGIYSGPPEKLIENDHISRLFDNTLIHFDKSNLQFHISDTQVKTV